MSRLSFILLCALLAQTLSRVSAQEFFFRGNNGFDALLRPDTPPLWPDEFAAKYGGVPLPAAGDWLPPAQYWVAYRYLGLRYWFEVLPPRSARQMVDDLKKRVQDDPELRIEMGQGLLRVYEITFAKGQRLPVADLMSDPGGNGQAEGDALKKELDRLSAKLDQAIKAGEKAAQNGSPDSMNKAWGDMRNVEAGLIASTFIIDAKGREMFNKLRSKYGAPPPGTKLPGKGMLSPAQIWATLAPDMKNGPYNDDGSQNHQQLTGPDGKPVIPPSNNGKPTRQDGKDKTDAPNNPGTDPTDNPGEKNNTQPGPTEKSNPGDNAAPGTDSKPDSGKPAADKSDSKDKKDGDSSRDGLKGPFKVKTPFAKWFAVTMKLVARYFGVEALGNRILFVAYMIAPEVFDACASFLAKCQLALAPKSLNDFLDKVADVYLAIEAFLPYLKQAYELLNDDNLKSLADHFDWTKFDLGKTLDALEKVKVLPKDKLDEIRKFAPIDLLNGKVLSNPDMLREKVQRYALDKAVEQADRGLGRIGISVSGLKNCIDAADKSACATDWAKAQAVNAATANIPGIKNHTEAINLLMQGKPKEAVESAAVRELANRAGLPIDKIQPIYDALERGDLKEFVLGGTELGLFKTARCQELSQAVIQAIRSGQAPDHVIREAAVCGTEIMGNKRATQVINSSWDIGEGMASAIRQHGSIGAWADTETARWKNKIRSELKNRGYTDQQARDWLLGTGATVLQGQLKKQLNVLGFNAPGAADAVLAGDLERAIDLQMQHNQGSPVPLKDKAEQMSQLLDLRASYLGDLRDDIRIRMQDPNYLESEIIKRTTKKTK